MVDMETIMNEMKRTQALLNEKKQNTSNPLPNPNINEDEKKEELTDENSEEQQTNPNEDDSKEKEKKVIKKQPKTKKIKIADENSSKKQPKPSSTKDNELLNGIKELNGNIVELLQLLKLTADEMRKEDPLAAKVEAISDQNDKIAQALLNLADMIKDFKEGQSQPNLNNVSSQLQSDLPNDPNMQTYREPQYDTYSRYGNNKNNNNNNNQNQQYTFMPDKLTPAFRPKFIASDTGEEMQLPVPPPDNFENDSHLDRMQPLPETRATKTSMNDFEAPEREQLRSLEFNKAPLSPGELKKRGMFR